MNLRQLCKDKGYTLTRLSEATGISNVYLSRLNTGTYINPTRDIMEKISTALGITLDELNESLKISERKIANE